jgi:hypothetical protein
MRAGVGDSMVDWYRCPRCRKLHALFGDFEKKCLLCGGTDGEVVSAEHMKQGEESGAYFSIGPDGKPKKKKRR